MNYYLVEDLILNEKGVYRGIFPPIPGDGRLFGYYRLVKQIIPNKHVYCTMPDYVMKTIFAKPNYKVKVISEKEAFIESL